MAIFSELPNELIISIWGYVIEPQSVENFALVSKRVYELATPFVEENQRLRQRYTKILDLEKGKHGRAAELLEAMLLNPRIAIYINELQIRGWADGWEDQDDSSQTQSYAGKIMDVFEDAFRSLSHISPFEAEHCVADMRSGHEGPLLALILIRLTELRRLEIYPCYSDSDGSLNMLLGGWSCFLETKAHPRRSTSESKRHPNNEAFLQLSRVSHISDLVISFCEIEISKILQLLGSTRKLKRFSLYGNIDFEDLYQICSGLLECSRQSLQSLCLRFDYKNILQKNYNLIIDAMSRFEMLLKLEVDIGFLLGSGDNDCNILIEMLPISIETLLLCSATAVAYETLRGVILQMVKHKVVHLPNLKALTFEQSFYLGPHDTTAPSTRTELRDTDSFSELSRKSAEVGFFLSVTKYEYPDSDEQMAFQVYLS